MHWASGMAPRRSAWLRRRIHRRFRLGLRISSQSTRSITAAQTAPPDGFVASIPLAPTPCDLAAQAVGPNGADGLSFSDWELVLSCRDKTPANKTAAEQLWSQIQAKEKNGEAKLKIPVKVIAVPDANS